MENNELKEFRQEVKEQFQETRNQFQSQFQEIRIESQKQFQEIRTEFQAQFQEVKEQFKDVYKLLDLMAKNDIRIMNDVDDIKKDQIIMKTDILEIQKSQRNLGLEFEAMRHDVRDALGSYVQHDIRISRLESTAETHTEEISLLKLTI